MEPDESDLLVSKKDPIQWRKLLEQVNQLARNLERIIEMQEDFLRKEETEEPSDDVVDGFSQHEK